MAKFHIGSTEAHPETGLVKKLHWFAVDEQNNHKVFDFGVADLEEKDANDPTFVSYDQISEELALQWLFKVIDKQLVEKNLAEKLIAIQQPELVSLPLPWQQ